jgi:hypothetical protein
VNIASLPEEKGRIRAVRDANPGRRH